MSAVLKHIATVAKGLSKAELHVLIELASRAEEAGQKDAVASSRELAEETGLARSSVQSAIDSLNSKGVIRSDAGTATRSAMHWLLFLDAVEVRLSGPIFRPEVARESGRGGLKAGPVVAQIPGQSGPTVRPVVARKPSQSGPNSGPEMAQVSGQGGLDAGPLPNVKSTTWEPARIENACAPAESIEKNDFDNLIDRLQKSKKSDFDDEVFEQARNLIASHHAKFAREDCRLPGLPDDQITAQFLAIADWPRLSHMLYDLMSERKQPTFSWAWYVTVALQRIHGISPVQAREQRAKLGNANTRRVLRTIATAKALSNRNCIDSGSVQSNPMYGFRGHPGHGMDQINEQMQALIAAKSIR